MPRKQRKGGGWRDIIAQRIMQQQDAAPSMAAPPQQMPQLPQMPMGGSGNKPMPAGVGLGSMGVAPQQRPMAGGMPIPQDYWSQWTAITGQQKPVDTYTPYTGIGGLSGGPGSMNMASLNAPYQAPVMPQTTGGPPLFPTGGN